MKTHKIIVEVTKDTIVSTDEFITIRKHQYKKEIVFTCTEFRNSYFGNSYTWYLEYIRDNDDDPRGLMALSKPPLNITIN